MGVERSEMPVTGADKPTASTDELAASTGKNGVHANEPTIGADKSRAVSDRTPLSFPPTLLRTLLVSRRTRRWGTGFPLLFSRLPNEYS
jgi:hypothetical protein